MTHWKSNAISPSSDQVENFFEPSVNAIIEGIKNVVAETDPANTVRIFRFSPYVGNTLTAS